MSTLVAEREPAQRGRRAEQALKVCDCDIHPSMHRPDEVYAFLAQRWQDHAKTYGGLYRQAFSDTLSHPRINEAASRRDSWPAGGGQPGSSLDLMRAQLLDAFNVEHGMLMPLNRGPGNQRNLEYGAALCSAINEWQVAKWLDAEPRLHGSILVPQEDAQLAVAEIERRVGNPRYVQIMMPPHTVEPLGRRRYWPIYQAAVDHNLPIALHVGGIGGHPHTNTGVGSYYIEDQHSNVQGMTALITSLVIEGVFERFPTLRVVLVEGGIAWAPALAWRLDKHWKRMKSEAPHLKLLPSQYMRRNIWFTTQPIDEPQNPADLAEVFETVGCDRIMFSTDYPHWDMDDPRYVMSRLNLAPEKMRAILFENARAFYGFD
ncbi:MAG: hypothetical protein JWN93_2791 [Hyphomicrobiales bacterium]|nr:hypothetical protein [Hyphomicrobiales bacterium]